jgi:Amt family ammonium transporter
MAIAVGYSFAVSFLIFKFINFIVPLRVTVLEEDEGLDASQHDEKYVQGTLIVTTKTGEIIEKESFVEEVEKVSVLRTNGMDRQNV